MAMDPIAVNAWGSALTTGAEAWIAYDAGKRAEQEYKMQAKEVEAESAYARNLALQEMKQLSRQGRSAESRAVAAAGKSGLRVAGSVVTMVDAISAQVNREKAMIRFQVNEEVRRKEFEAAWLRYRGKSKRKAAQLKAYQSLLTGGAQLAKEKERSGRSWGEFFFGKSS